MILFRDVCGQIWPISTLKGSKMLVNIIIISFHPKSMDRDVSDDVIMTLSNRVHHWPNHIIHIKFGEDRMINDQVITFTGQEWAIFAGNQWTVTDDVIMMSLIRVRHGPHFIIHIKFGEPQMRNGQVITLTCYEWAIFTNNQWTVTSVMTSSWRHSIHFVLNHMLTILQSLVKFGCKLMKLFG